MTCLTVTGHRAVIGGPDIDRTGSAYLFLVEDNAASGTPDRLDYNFTGAARGAYRLSQPRRFRRGQTSGPLQSWNGDLVVHDAAPPTPTSKDQCKGNGWRNFPGFKNQGSCISFLNR